MSQIKESLKDIYNFFLCKIHKQKCSSLFTYHIRPIEAKEYDIIHPDFTNDKSVAIILQGNIMYKYNYTIETIKLYRRLYPNAIIILSTWNYEDKVLLGEVKALGVHVIASDLPESKGHGTINYQLKSTREGINFAKSFGVEYILKTRTDQRLCAENSITYMMNLMKQYPMKLNLEGTERLVVCSSGCFSNRLYNVSDMVLFGKTEDVERYFSAPFDTRNNIDYSQENQEEYSKNRPGEIYFSTHYIESLGLKLNWDITDSNHYFKELFIIVDSESLDWAWPKYTSREYRWRKYEQKELVQITYKDWLNLYMEELK